MNNIVFIKKEFFVENPNFVEMLDPFDLPKQTARQYLYVNVKYKGNNILVPLRRNIGSNLKLYYPVPSKTRPNAGLDYRKMLIVNNEAYIEIPSSQRLADSQTKIINDNYDTIEKSVIKYIEGYIKSANKNREHRDYEYSFSTLHNFHEELGII
jgi:protein AbiQ